MAGYGLPSSIAVHKPTIHSPILDVFMTADERYMARCIQLAQCGRAGVAPNPMVGAVIVYHGAIIGEGYHRQCGGPHAEVNAIRSVRDSRLLREATIYVSLEPCAHYGKTPPCADLIIEQRIPRVVIGCHDSFDQVDGRGIRKLREAGIEVTVGVLEQECRELNRAFFIYHSRRRPYITLKWAQSTDGYIDVLRNEGGADFPVRLSNDGTVLRVHRLRALNDAILVGRRTAVLDNPSLTTRMWPGCNPLRVAVDRYGRIGKELRLFDKTAKTILFTEVFRNFGDTDKIEQVKLDFGCDILPQIGLWLYEHKVQRLLVEGGATTLQHFIDAGLWDEAFVETAPVRLYGGVEAPYIGNEYESETFESYGHQITRFLHEK